MPQKFSFTISRVATNWNECVLHVLKMSFLCSNYLFVWSGKKRVICKSDEYFPYLHLLLLQIFDTPGPHPHPLPCKEPADKDDFQESTEGYQRQNQVKNRGFDILIPFHRCIQTHCHSLLIKTAREWVAFYSVKTPHCETGVCSFATQFSPRVFFCLFFLFFMRLTVGMWPLNWLILKS